MQVSDYVSISAIVLVIITCILSYFTLVFGELVPKRFAMQNGEKIAFAVIGFLTIFEKFTRPFVKFLSFSTNGIIRLFGGDPNATDENVTEEEIRMMVDVGNENGTIDNEEREFIQNVFEFDSISVEEIIFQGVSDV